MLYYFALKYYDHRAQEASLQTFCNYTLSFLTAYSLLLKILVVSWMFSLMSNNEVYTKFHNEIEMLTAAGI